MDHPLSYPHPNPGWVQHETSNCSQEVDISDGSIIGKHCILELYDCNKDKLNDELIVNKAITEAVQFAGATLIDIKTHRFKPQGLTSLALLAESHISIHTWPEIGYGAADVFTCGDHTMPERACDILIKELSAKKFSLRRINRLAPSEIINFSNHINY